MDFQFTDSENNFRNEVRDFTKKNLSTEFNQDSTLNQAHYLNLAFERVNQVLCKEILAVSRF